MDLTLSDFTAQLSSAQPAPGGGGAAALTGALAASLTAMAANVTAANPRYAARSDALRSLIQFRRALQFSYAYGYYLGRKSPKLELFQYLQENLEKFTNHLAELCETRLEKITDFFRWKEEIINYTRVTTKYLTNFSHGVAGGL